MGLAERRLILRSGGSAGWRSLALAAVETVLTAGWGLLLFAAVRLATGRTIPEAAPACYLAAVILATWLERRSRRRRGNPLSSLGLEAVATDGRNPEAMRTFVRLVLTPPSLLLACAGYLPLLGGARPVPELASGTMMLSLQPQLDPRPERVMRAERAKSRRLVLSYSFLSLAAGLLVMLVPVRHPSDTAGRRLADASGLSGEDGVLLVYYLDKAQRHPDSLEFHVRLASLYYRNRMEGDLAVELREIARLDPDHPMLLLGQDLSVDIEDLLQREHTVSDSAAAARIAAAAADSSEEDSSGVFGEGEFGDSLAGNEASAPDESPYPAEADSATAQPAARPDTTGPMPPDSVPVQGPTATTPNGSETPAVPAAEPTIPDSTAAPEVGDTSAVAESPSPAAAPDSATSSEPTENDADGLRPSAAPADSAGPAEEAGGGGT